MKLLRCYIANYGCLHNFTCEFASPVHVICKPNGWGKSTLTSFLCSMFYGLEASSRRSIADNERKHYTPWQGGVFGGSIEFEANGCSYRAERTFGSKEKEDTFCLYNLYTMQSSRDFTENLGQELFGIDRAGFLHTIYIPQGRISSACSDSITARLCGIVESQSDILQYEKAVSSIDSVLRTYVKTGRRGRIDALIQEKDQVEQQLFHTSEASHQVSAVMDQLTALEEQKNSCSLELDNLNEKIRRRTEQDLYAHYRTLQTRLQDAEAALEQDELFFHDQFPEQTDIALYLEQCTELSELEKQYRETCLSAVQSQEYLFLQTVFTPDEDCHHSDNFSDRQKKLLLHSSLYQMEAGLLFSSDMEHTGESAVPSSSDPEQAAAHPASDTEELSAVMTLSDTEAEHQLSLITDARNQFFRFQSLQSDFSRLNSECKALQQKLSDPFHSGVHTEKDAGQPVFPFGNSFTALPFLPVFLCILIGAALCFAFSFSTAGIVFSLLELIWIVYGLYHSYQTRRDFAAAEQHQQQLSALLLEKQQKCSDLSVSLQSCTDCISSCFRQLQLPDPGPILTEENCISVLNRYYDRLTNRQQLRIHREKITARQKEFYARLKKKYLDYNRAFLAQQRTLQKLNDLTGDISNFLSAYYTLPKEISVSFLENRLFHLQTRLNSYLTEMEHLKSASGSIRQFLDEHPDFDLSRPDRSLTAPDPETGFETEPLTQLQQQEQRIREQLDFCTAEMVKLQSKLLPLQSLADTRSSLEDRKVHLNQQIENCRTHYHTLSLTAQYLKQAREQFTCHYLKSIENHFQHYISLFGKEILSDITLDSDFHALITDHGILYNTDWFSRGIQDLIHFCIRLSIITDLYPEETPFLILDDPFVNLDDPVRQKASEILKELSDRWQIIYLTCHENFLSQSEKTLTSIGDE